MSHQSDSSTPTDPSLNDLLAQYIAGEEAGQRLDRNQLLAAHPHLASELREFFINRDQILRLAEPLRGTAAPSRVGGFPIGKLRYFGDYELLEEIAIGGMGIVYKARQVSLNRIVAVKMILKGTLAREDDVKRFKAEAEAAANLQHSAIVAIHEVGMHEGQHYFSMDFVDGHSLAELPREQPLLPRQAAEYIRDAAEAVHYAHLQGTLHRDLKPSNILIDRQGRVRITDFGLAKRIEADSDLTHTGQILGTPSYMPPEQALGKASLVGVASDIYSLGAVLYELLTGRPPFRGQSLADTLRQVETMEAVSPRLLSPAIPRDLETICLKCLEKEPHKRYVTAQILADDLGRYLRGEPIVARSIGRMARGWRWCQRNPTIAVLSAAIAVLLSFSTIASTVGYISTRRALQSEVQRRLAEDNLQAKESLELMLGPRPNFALADEQFSAALVKRPNNAVVLLHRAMARWERGLTHKAMDDALRSLELRPSDNEAAWLQVLEAALELGDSANAREAAEKLQRESKGTPQAFAAAALLAPLESDSLHAISQAVQREPFDPRYIAIRGQVAFQLTLYRTSRHHYQQAVSDLERVLQSRPFDWRARQRLCACYVLFHFLAEEHARPLDRAKELLDDWLAAAPDDLVALALLTRWHMAQEQWDEALAVGERGRNLDAGDLELAGVYGEILLHQRQCERADEVFQAAGLLLENQPLRVALPTTRVRIAGLRAQCSIVTERFEAVDERLAEFQPGPENAHWTYFDWEAVTTANRLLGDKQEAVKGGGSAEPASGRMRCQVLCDQWQPLAPECSGPILAPLSLKPDANDEIKPLNAAFTLSPSLRWERFHRGRILARTQGHDSQAIADLEAFLRQLPDQSLAQWELARLRLNAREPQLRDPGQAVELARRVVAREPEKLDAWQMIAETERSLGHFAESLVAIDALIGKHSRTAAFLALRGDVLTDLGRFAEARGAYDRALQGTNRSANHLDAIAARLALPGHGNKECYERALALGDELQALRTKEAKPDASHFFFSTGVVLYRVGRWEDALVALDAAKGRYWWGDAFDNEHSNYGGADLELFRAMTLWRLDRRKEAWAQYHEVARELGGKRLMLDPTKRRLAELRRETARLIGAQLGAEPITADIEERSVGPSDYPQWGGWAGRNNIRHGSQSPIDWDPGTFDRKTGVWRREKSRNIKWVSPLGSQTYGNPVVANGKIFVGTNNSNGYLKRYPSELDLGVLLCFRESDGEFLWQHSCEKLPTGRVHDWPLQGICSSPLAEGDRLWVVTNRGEVVCLDAEGFRDGEDDGPVQGLKERLFRVRPSAHAEFSSYQIPESLNAAFSAAGVKFPGPWTVEPASGQWTVDSVSNQHRWYVYTNTNENRRRRYLQIDLVNDELQARLVDESQPEPQPVIAVVRDRLWDGLGSPAIVESLRGQFARAGMELPPKIEVEEVTPGTAWKFNLIREDGHMEVVVRQGSYIDAFRTDFTNSKDLQQSDVVWSLDMMKELGVSQHNMATCAPTAWKNTLFICTSNGVDEAHMNIPAPEAPSFIALDKHTGKVLWTDNSPGKNIQHGQWSAPAVGVFAGVPQVIFCGGDGWVYGFHAEEWKDEKPILLWKFDSNPKDTILELGGRGTRNDPLAIPVVYDGLVYLTTGQDPEHGEGVGYLWCIDPTRRGDVSPQLAVTVNDRNTVLPHKRIRAVEPEKGEIAIDNPNSAVVWSYSRLDANGDKNISFTEQFHRSISSVAIKDDILVTCDFSGLAHCLNAKTGQRYWTSDLLAAVWGTPLIVGDRVYLPDEDGDIAIFSLDPTADGFTRHPSLPEVEDRLPMHEINMGNSVYATPIFANGTLYIANKDHLFAIATPDKADPNRPSEKNLPPPR